MYVLLKLWGIFMIGGGGYLTYIMIDNCFIKGAFFSVSNILKIFFIAGILCGITLVWGGFKLVTLKKNN